MNSYIDHRSPNYTDLDITVEYVVIHCTATSLERTLSIFEDPGSEVSAHVVIDGDGRVYEVVPCLNGTAKRAWHAGRSRMEVVKNGDSRVVESFNDKSIGIELVNYNGNIFPYTEAQYSALFGLLGRLKGLYSPLGVPESVVGHEDIAGFRGKCDPGIQFEWDRLFAVCFPNQGAPRRRSVCSRRLAEKMASMTRALGVSWDAATGKVLMPEGFNHSFFEHLSSLVEVALSRDDG